MRLLNTFSLVLLLSGLAAAQVTVIGGTASNWAPAYGVYAAPFVPLVITPSVTLGTTSPWAGAGATSATFGNVAGATNSTLSIMPNAAIAEFTQPVWYSSSSGTETSAEATPSSRRGQRSGGIDLGVGSWQSGQSVTYAMAASTGARRATRSFSNQDVDRVNETNGTVKFRGKTQHI
jgi:hypothetical protein